MINWWLIVVCVIVCFMVLAAVAYLLAKYSSPEDKNQAWLPKGIVVLAVSLAFFSVLLLPFDVANRADAFKLGGKGGGLDVVLLWQIVLLATVIMALLVVPFAMFYYEALGADAEAPSLARQVGTASCYTCSMAAIFVVALVVMWLLLGETQIPVQAYEGTLYYETDFAGDFAPLLSDKCAPGCGGSPETLDIRVSIFVYVVALMCAFGWAIFVFFGAIGIATLPIDLIRDWMHHPKPITFGEFNTAKEQIGTRSHDMLQKGKSLEKEAGRGGLPWASKRKINEFKLQVLCLKEEYEALELAYRSKGGSPFLAWGKLLLGVLASLLSFLWLLHILLFNLTSITGFLNNMFIGLDSAFPFFGVVAYSLFVVYLLWATFKGVIKVGVRFLFFQIHPMKVHDTLMNSFLFNCILILSSSITITQFAAMSFREFAAETAVDSMFMTYIRYLKFLGPAFWYLQFVFFALIILSFFLVLCCCTGNKTRKEKQEKLRSVLRR